MTGRLEVASVWAIDDDGWSPNTWSPPGEDEWRPAGGGSWRHEPSGSVLWWQSGNDTTNAGSLRLAA
jgi:hypothetical protein